MMFNFFDEMKKEKKRQKLRGNQFRGKWAEANYETKARLQSKEVKRTGRGSDYKERYFNPITGTKSTWTYVEIKSGNSKLSKLQKKTKISKKNYRVERQRNMFV